MNKWVVVFVAVPLLGLCARVHGDPVFGEILPLHRPDGACSEVRVWGDEFYRVLESLDGYTLVRDPTGAGACYARLSPDGNGLISTGIPLGSPVPAGLKLEKHIRINPAATKAEIAAARARFAEGEAQVLRGLQRRDVLRGPPSSGNVQGIVLLVDFSDEEATIPAEDFEDYCNQESGYSGYGNNGSIREYFYDVSDGHLTYTNFVPTAYYRADNPRWYYEDPGIPYGTRARELVLEALNDLEDNGFDFSQYDSNGDALIDAVNTFYAGTRYPDWGVGLWPHSWTVSFTADGVSTYKYQITDIGDSLQIRTFCHENGHMICYWPDLYDYDHDSSGVGQFCIMCAGTSSTDPQEPCAYLKDLSGWSTTTILTTPQAGLAVPSDANTFYKFNNSANANEYYIIENRQQAGRDIGLPDAGLAIWHIDTQGSNNYQQMTPELHYKATLVQADGNWDLETDVNNGDATDLWKAPTYTECTPGTAPNTNWWDGSVSGLFVSDISDSGSVMTFNFATDCNANGVPDDQDISGGTSLDCNGNVYPDECELAQKDCNANSIPDDCDITAGTSLDCNANSVPDECDLTGGGVLLDSDFEQATPPFWLPSGTFQFTGECGTAHPDCGGSGWAYTGDVVTCSYGDSESGELRAPPVTLGIGLSELRFCSRLETEWDWDWGMVKVDDEVVWRESGGTGEWGERTVDLRAFAGQTVTITFEFTSDSNTSGWLGWQVDNVVVVSGSPNCDSDGTPDECEADSDGDGTIDDCDGCPDDVNKTAPGVCGCSVPDDDSDSDAVPDCIDQCPGHDDNVDNDDDGVPDGCDNCELFNPDQLDCQPNGIGDVCDIASGSSPDVNNNEVPDECDPNPPTPETGGPGCGTGSDCVGAWVGADCIAGRCYVPKNRYLSVDPTSNDSEVAYRVEIVEAADYPTAVGRTWWVDEPACYDYPNGDPVLPAPPTCEGVDRFGWVSRLNSLPVTRIWTESPLHVTDCGIAPAVVYEIRASTDGGASLSVDALVIGTAHNPDGDTQFWGDITGGPVPGMPGLWLAPERATNFGDVGNAIRTFENRSEDTGFPPRVWVDVEIDQVVNLGDVSFIVMAFEGRAYADIGLELIGVHPVDCP